MKRETKAKVPVSERALIARINRRFLAEDNGWELRKSRSQYMLREYGDYFIKDTRLNLIQGYANLDLETLAKEWDALEPYECLAT
jgi:hypothetical protein